MSTDNFMCSESPAAQHGELIYKYCLKSSKSFKGSKGQKPNHPKKRAKLLLFFQLTKYYDIFFTKILRFPYFPRIILAIMHALHNIFYRWQLAFECEFLLL